MRRSFPFVLLATLLVLSGCFTPSPVAKMEARSKLMPVVGAVEAFKSRTGRVPESIRELEATSAIKHELSYSTSSGLVWSISYSKKSATSYEVAFHHVHYDLYYSDGKESGWNFNPWR